MELVERTGFLASLQECFDDIATGEGRCVLVCGESGIGKTSLVRAFCNSKRNECKIYQGSCDSLFTPRLLAPLYDIALQMQSDVLKDWDTADRTILFSRLFNELSSRREPVIIVFEDVHWADEATLDFIKFLARRISLTKCMFVLTYRDNEIHPRHPFRNVLGQLPPHSVSRLQLTPLSREAVEAMSTERGYRGEGVYGISGGNPFYVNEILASYSPGVPDNIKDAVLAVYNLCEDNTKRVWSTLSVLPTGINVSYLEKMEPAYAKAIENCLQSRILLVEQDTIFFKHELYRRTIEASLSPFVRLALNKRILDLFCEDFEKNHEMERIIHHAKNANEYAMVMHYAPLAARQAALVGAHTEAAKLYFTAIEYYRGLEDDAKIQLYEWYAYECLLVNRHDEAIVYIQKSLDYWKKKADDEKAGNCTRFLSRLWWYKGDRRKAEDLGERAVEAFKQLPASKAKAMTYCNMSHLKLAIDRHGECISWAEEAIALARQVDDAETLTEALTYMGSALMLSVVDPSAVERGVELLEQSLEIAKENSFQEHMARVYFTLGSNGVTTKNYSHASAAFDKGIKYCEERDLDSLKLAMQAWEARLNLETGNWNAAYAAAANLLENENLLPINKIALLTILATIKIRRGDESALTLLHEAKAMALATMELYLIIPTFMALLEYEWITGKSYIEPAVLSTWVSKMIELEIFTKKSRFYFWLWKAGRDNVLPAGISEDYEAGTATTAMKQAALWEKWGCPYEKALALSEGNDDDKKRAILMVQELGASAVYEKLKQEMRTSGIRNIPRGARKSTLANPANLTQREISVLQELQEGLKNKEIADKLFISAKTVDHHISSILVKLNVDSRARAVNEAARLGILK